MKKWANPEMVELNIVATQQNPSDRYNVDFYDDSTDPATFKQGIGDGSGPTSPITDWSNSSN